VRRPDVGTNSPTNLGADVVTISRRSQEEQKPARTRPTPPATSFVLSEWMLLLGVTGCVWGGRGWAAGGLGGWVGGWVHCVCIYIRVCVCVCVCVCV